jgi:hypothetical protein
VDLAIVPLRPLERAARDLGVQLYYHASDSQRIPDAATVREFDALEDVLFVGYPSGVWDQVNLMPILRRGTTATPLELDFEGAQAIPDRRRRVSRIERQPGIRGAGRSAPSTRRRGAHHLVRWSHSGGVFPRRGQPARAWAGAGADPGSVHRCRDDRPRPGDQVRIRTRAHRRILAVPLKPRRDWDVGRERTT